MTDKNKKRFSLIAWIARLFQRKQIIEYDWIRSKDHKWVQDTVNQKIKEGWQPFGRPFIYEGNSYYMKVQPMVKYGYISK